MVWLILNTKTFHTCIPHTDCTIHAPSPVQGFVADRETSTMVSLSWTRLNGVIQYYNMEVTNLNTSILTRYYIVGSETSAEIKSLHPNHHYQFSIAAFTVAMGPFTSITLQLPRDGINVTIHYHTNLNKSYYIMSVLIVQSPLEVHRLLTAGHRI